MSVAIGLASSGRASGTLSRAACRIVRGFLGSEGAPTSAIKIASPRTGRIRQSHNQRDRREQGRAHQPTSASTSASGGNSSMTASSAMVRICVRISVSSEFGSPMSSPRAALRRASTLASLRAINFFRSDMSRRWFKTSTRFQRSSRHDRPHGWQVLRPQLQSSSSPACCFFAGTGSR